MVGWEGRVWTIWNKVCSIRDRSIRGKPGLCFQQALQRLSGRSPS